MAHMDGYYYTPEAQAGYHSSSKGSSIGMGVIMKIRMQYGFYFNDFSLAWPTATR